MQWGSIIFIFTTQIAEFVCRLGYSSGARIKTGDFIREHFLECLIHSTNPQGNGATFKNAVHLLPVTKNEFISHFSPRVRYLMCTIDLNSEFSSSTVLTNPIRAPDIDFS